MEDMKDDRSNFMIALNNLWVLFLVLMPTAIIYGVIIAAVFTVNSTLATILLAIIILAIGFEIVKDVKNKFWKKEDIKVE